MESVNAGRVRTQLIWCSGWRALYHPVRDTVAEPSASLNSLAWTVYGSTIQVTYFMSFRTDCKSGTICANNEQQRLFSSIIL